MNLLSNKLVSFFILGMTIVIFVTGLILLSYLLIVGAAIGLILYAVNWFTEKYFPNSALSKRGRKEGHPHQETKKTGRTIDHDQL